MPSLISYHNYPGYEKLGDVFNLSAATSFSATADTTIVACSGQVGESAAYSPFHPSGPDNEQFAGGHAEQFEVALRNVEKALAAAQPALSSRELWDGVYNITSFQVGTVPQEDQLAIAEVARRVLGGNRPAWSAIGVLALFPPKCLAEVQVQAVYSSGGGVGGGE